MEDVSKFQMPQQPTTTRHETAPGLAAVSVRLCARRGQEANRGSGRAEHTLTALAGAFLPTVDARHNTTRHDMADVFPGRLGNLGAEMSLRFRAWTHPVALV
jgi:hypothetical protein